MDSQRRTGFCLSGTASVATLTATVLLIVALADDSWLVQTALLTYIPTGSPTHTDFTIKATLGLFNQCAECTSSTCPDPDLPSGPKKCVAVDSIKKCTACPNADGAFGGLQWVRTLLIIACIIGFITSFLGLFSCNNDEGLPRTLATISYYGLLAMALASLASQIIFESIVNPDIGGLVDENSANFEGFGYHCTWIVWALCFAGRFVRIIENRIWRKYRAVTSGGQGAQLLADGQHNHSTVPVAQAVAEPV